MPKRKPISSINPLFYRLSILLRQTLRRLKWLLLQRQFSLTAVESLLPVIVTEHKSLLFRKLAGTDPDLQRNKVESLRQACNSMNGIVVKPGETFSFWRLVGRPTEQKGFKPGLQLSFGELVSRTGGGLCQLSNLLHWMVLHTPMTVTERHRHHTDPFPDYRRTVPFGSGATVFYNYLDFMFLNETKSTFQVRTWVSDEYLHGEIRTGKELLHRLSVVEKRHRFLRTDDEIYRENELWRIEFVAATGEVVSEKLLLKNHSKVGYDTDTVPGIEVVDLTGSNERSGAAKAAPQSSESGDTT